MQKGLKPRISYEVQVSHCPSTHRVELFGLEMREPQIHLYATMTTPIIVLAYCIAVATRDHEFIPKAAEYRSDTVK